MTSPGHPLAAPGLFLAVACALILTSDPAYSQAGYRYYSVGNPGDVTTPTRGLVVMQGGGDDVDFNYQHMGEMGGRGDFVVLRASGSDDYNEYIFPLCSCDSVETIVFESREASFDDFVIGKIRNAEALFIAGGDQSNYVRYWKDTPVEDAIHFVAAKPAPIGGTSAGMAILGEYSYSAMTENSLTSSTAMSDPFHPDLTIETDFLRLPGLGNLITDQHLVERDRIGRTLALMARLLADGSTTTARAIAADRETSLHIEVATGVATVYATREHDSPFVYFMKKSGMPDACEAGMPLTISGIEVSRLGPGDSFDIASWSGTGGISYRLDVEAGRLISTRDAVY